MSTQIRPCIRLKSALKAAGYKTAKAFAKAHHIPQTTFNQHVSGRRKINDQALKKYAELLGVRFEWLKTGQKPYFANDRREASPEAIELLVAEESFDMEATEAANLINEDLLSHILKALLTLYEADERNQLSPNDIATAASGIYNDICRVEDDPRYQRKAINTAILSYKRYALNNARKSPKRE